ncbi:MAG: hypothetical protein KJ645_05750 [Planctomycetes bacterium]|nr:hypothetical protein [Planctomycetota bacterium]
MKTSYGFAVLIAGCLFWAIPLACTSQAQVESNPTKTLTQNEKPELKIDGMTLYPVSLAGNPHKQVAQVLGVILEQEGFRKLELAEVAFQSKADASFDQIAADFGAFIAKQTIQNNYALYGEILASREKGFFGVRGVIVDRTGKVVWTDDQGPGDQAFDKAKLDCPMTCCAFLAERVKPALVLKTPGENDGPGPLERQMSEKSGIPAGEEWDAMEKRLSLLRKNCPEARITIFPVRKGDQIDRNGAEQLATLLNEKKLCNALVAEEAPHFDIKPDSNEQRILWDMARSFKDYVKNHKSTTDYALYADYMLNEEKGFVGAVHFALCDRQGDWVIVDYQNNHHDDFESISPKSVKDCTRLAMKRLEGYLDGSYSAN